ncbi:MAG: ATP-binding protein [Micrococcales bacterium]|nr:ATP-binding protein [Micrococcales bacterium]
MNLVPFTNPYRPGAGHMPPYLAGRAAEYDEFERLLAQDDILDNLILTGLRGVGKTVLLETLRPRAQRQGWLWVGADLSESASVTEESLAIRIITDLAVVTSSFTVTTPPTVPTGFSAEPLQDVEVALGYDVLKRVYDSTPGLVSDKLRTVLELAHACLSSANQGRLIFAYDEAQNLADGVTRDQFPLSLLLDVFQSIQRRGVPFMLVLAGLPTLFGKLVDARTYAERMFRVVTLGRLSEDESREAIVKPVESANCPVRLDEASISTICRESGGYPYFIQFICREAYDVFAQGRARVPIDAIQRKLDTDFFAGRWARVTDRQRQLLYVAAQSEAPDEEFTVQEIVARSQELLEKGFSPSHVSQMLGGLADHGLVYKNRFGKYSFAVPHLGRFILRNFTAPEVNSDPPRE